jgi:hypothetical protein
MDVTNTISLTNAPKVYNIIMGSSVNFGPSEVSVLPMGVVGKMWPTVLFFLHLMLLPFTQL